MSTVSHGPSGAARETPGWSLQLLVPEVCASLAITMMWLAVLLVALFGPDIVSNDVAGNHTTVPSAVVIAPLAFLGTWVVAKYGLGTVATTTNKARTQRVRTSTSLSTADSAPHSSPGRPRSWRTAAEGLGSWTLRKRDVLGSKRTSVFAPKSESQTTSRSST